MSRASWRSGIWARLSGRYASLAGARIASAFCRWFVLFKSAHLLTPTEFGIVAACLSAVELLTGFGDLGADSFVYARPSRPGHPLPELVKAALCARFATSTAFLLLGLLVVLFAFKEPRLAPILLLIPASAFQNTATALLQKQNRFDLLAASALLALFVSICVSVAAVFADFSIAMALLLLVAPAAISALGSCMLAKSQIAEVLRGGIASLARARGVIFSKLVQTATVSCLVILYSRLDVLVVTPICGLAVQAEFSAAFRLIEPFFTLLAIFSTAALAELGVRSSNSAQLLGVRLLGVMGSRFAVVLMLTPLVTGTLGYLFISYALHLTPATANVASVLGATIPFRVANGAFSAVMQRLSGFALVMRATMLNAAVTFPTAALLAWQYGSVGAAIGALAGEMVNFYIQRHSLAAMLAKRGFYASTSRLMGLE